MRYLCFLLTIVSVAAHDVHVPPAKYVPAAIPLEIGTGEFRYRLVPNWAQHNRKKYPIGNGKAVVEDRHGNLYFLNANRKHCVIVLNKRGEALKAWGDFAKSPHGINIVREGDREVLFISDNGKNGKIYKTTLDGEILLTVSCPLESGLYEDGSKFRPAEIIPIANGDFFVLDGYGSDYILRFNSEGKFMRAFGGDIGNGEARLAHWGPHGGNIDRRDPKNPILVLGLSDQQKSNASASTELGSTLSRFPEETPAISSSIATTSLSPTWVTTGRSHATIPASSPYWITTSKSWPILAASRRSIGMANSNKCITTHTPSTIPMPSVSPATAPSTSPKTRPTTPTR